MLLMTFSLCPTILIVAAVSIIVMGAYWYSEERKGWFHLFLRMVWAGKFMLIVLGGCLYIMLACKVDSLKIVLDCPNEYALASTEVLFSLTGGIASGYIIYLFSVLVPKAIRQRPILYILKERLWYAKCEIEESFSVIYGKRYLDDDSVEDFSKALTIGCEQSQYTIKSYNCKYILQFIEYVQSTLNSFVNYSDYFDDKDLTTIKTIIHHATRVVCRLHDYDGIDALFDENSIVDFATEISTIYINLSNLYTKLEKIV